jgi:hypothetical protein
MFAVKKTTDGETSDVEEEKRWKKEKASNEKCGVDSLERPARFERCESMHWRNRMSTARRSEKGKGGSGLKL